MKYLGKIHWSWGGSYRFDKIKEVTLNDKSELTEILKKFIVKITRDFAYDCNRIEKPLNPRINIIELIPVAKSQLIDFEEIGLQKYLDNEIEWYGQLIQEGKAYVDVDGGRYSNCEISPKNKEIEIEANSN